ncbi:MAG: sigma-54-dependent Fis family transcriptional regulator [Betaproteobacteria bacterium HGW-Betaproteobacteria-11]|nr:MAG: sigma-54-dependent Fis family transcriptional regulator [Betaproteobacteria bacterium HGW-Betaproteobacteria-11]
MAKILIVDDEVGIRELLSEILRDEGHDIVLAANAATARTARAAARPDLVLLDIWMPDTDGITLLKEWAGSGLLTMPVVMMSGHATIETAVEATKIGALDFLEKPVGMQKLLTTVKQALERGARQPEGVLSLAAFGRPGPLRDLKRRLEQLLAHGSLLLLHSPPGGLAELVARTALPAGKPWHDLGQANEVLDNTLLRRLAGGVLWCEELARLSRLQQKNLLFAADQLDRHGLRLLVATRHERGELTALGWEAAALDHLFATLLGVPALGELGDEIPDIATHLLTQVVETEKLPLRRFSSAALNLLRQYSWPAGYDELKSVVRSLALASLGEEISAEDAQSLLPSPVSAKASPWPPGMLDQPLREAREVFERLYFEYHLASNAGNMTQLAEKTGLERTHLYRKLKDLGLRQ